MGTKSASGAYSLKKAVKSMVQIQESAIQFEAPQPSAVCVHHWIIGLPDGPVSRGMCKKCGAEREFNNYVGDPGQWRDEVSLDQVTSGAYFQESTPRATADDWAD